jgi:hypothetical protein
VALYGTLTGAYPAGPPAGRGTPRAQPAPAAAPPPAPLPPAEQLGNVLRLPRKRA